MRKVLLAALGAICVAGAAHAGERENAMRHIAQVTAVQKLCSKVAVNSGLVLMVAMRFGIDFERDQAEMMALVDEQTAPWDGQGEDAACTAGILLYGPEGSSVPNLLKWK